VKKEKTATWRVIEGEEKKKKQRGEKGDLTGSQAFSRITIRGGDAGIVGENKRAHRRFWETPKGRRALEEKQLEKMV